nr:IS1 family transposase [Xenorhabdus poinarii]
MARRTICYSRSMEIHEKLIGAYHILKNIITTLWSQDQ